MRRISVLREALTAGTKTTDDLNADQHAMMAKEDELLDEAREIEAVFGLTREATAATAAGEAVSGGDEKTEEGRYAVVGGRA